MRTTWKPLTFLLSLTFLFLFSGSVYGDDLLDGVDALERKDYKEALRLFLPLAEQGDNGSQYVIGEMYANGQGVPQDYKEAVKWYRLAAEQGNPGAQNQLGRKYILGKGVPQDYKEGVKWLRLSAEWGNQAAQFNLGMMYSMGTGVPKDYVLAHMWVNLAASSGKKRAIENRNRIEKKMSPSQIEKAKEMARNWKPTKQ